MLLKFIVFIFLLFYYNVSFGQPKSLREYIMIDLEMCSKSNANTYIDFVSRELGLTFDKEKAENGWIYTINNGYIMAFYANEYDKIYATRIYDHIDNTKKWLNFYDKLIIETNGNCVKVSEWQYECKAHTLNRNIFISIKRDILNKFVVIESR